MYNKLHATLLSNSGPVSNLICLYGNVQLCVRACVRVCVRACVCVVCACVFASVYLRQNHVKNDQNILIGGKLCNFTQNGYYVDTSENLINWLIRRRVCVTLSVALFDGVCP